MQQPFGHFALSALRNGLRDMSGRVRNRVKFLSTILRKASMFGIAEPYDVEPAEGFKVRLYPSNNATDKNAYMGLEIADTPQIMAINQAACRCSGDTFHFVDIGGNSGMFTIAAARAAYLAGKRLFVVAIEANDAMAERLRFNLEASGVKNPLIYINAVSNKNDKVFLSLAKKNLGQATVVSDFVAGQTISVQARLLKELLDEANMRKRPANPPCL